MTIFLCSVHYFTSNILNVIIFCIHFMLAQIFYFNRPESSQACMQCHFCKTDSFYLQAFYQFTAEMKTGCWCCHGSLMLCIYGLVAFFVFFIRLALDIFWQRCFTQFFKHATEFFFTVLP